MKKTIVIGSLAYDNIMKFDGDFSDSISTQKSEMLSVSFLANDRICDFGGCSTNIAYTLSLLEEDPVMVAVAGNDFEKYKKRLDELGLDTSFIVIDEGNPTAAAYILSDNKNSQITIFAPGAMGNDAIGMGFPEGFTLPAADIGCAILSPDLPDRMASFGDELISKEIPFIFDPGQAITALPKDYLSMLTDLSLGVIANEFEVNMLCERLSISKSKMAKKAGFLIETLGDAGCKILQAGSNFDVPAVPGLKVLDVTGAGDAFRAGFIHGLNSGETIKCCCEMANTAASYEVESRGTQSHNFSKAEFLKRLSDNFGN